MDSAAASKSLPHIIFIPLAQLISCYACHEYIACFLTHNYNIEEYNPDRWMINNMRSN